MIDIKIDLLLLQENQRLDLYKCIKARERGNGKV
jgi:hypothetical protein